MYFERINTGSLTHAQRKCRSRPVDARRRVRVGNFFDVNGAARAGHRDELLARAADEFALGIARGLAECVQSRRACRACWTERRSGRRDDDAAAAAPAAMVPEPIERSQLRGHRQQIGQSAALTVSAALPIRAAPTRAREAAPIPASSDADRPAPAGSAALRLLADVDISF